MQPLPDTERLTLHEITKTDVDLLHRLDSDPEVMRYIGPTRSKEEVASKLDSVIEYYRKHEGFGVWLLRLKSSSEFIGWGCLKHLDKTDHIEVGYRLLRKHWGKGYATEFSKKIIRYGFENLALGEIVGITHPDHVKSRKVLEKCGLRFIKMSTYYGARVKLYGIKREMNT